MEKTPEVPNLKLNSRSWQEVASCETAKFKVKVGSFNVLAQCYIQSSYFPFAAKSALRVKHRKAHLLAEIEQLQADILCFQEFDLQSYWVPTLRNLGFEGSVAMRTSTKQDSSAIFWKVSRFELVEGHTIQFNDLAKIHGQEKYARDNVAAVVCLRDREASDPSHLAVACTHLFWDPAWMEVKAGQAQFFLSNLQAFLALQCQKLNQDHIPWIIGGDFNSTPGDPVYRLIMEGKVDLTKPDGEPGLPENLLEHNMPVNSAYSFYTRKNGEKGEPPFTNYTPNFKGCLDYLFFDRTAFQVSKLLALPTEEQLMAETAIPSTYYSSDHVPICAEFCTVAK